MGLWSILIDYIKDLAEDYVGSARDHLMDNIQRIYQLILLSIGSVLMFAFSLSALVQKIADSLDKDSGFIWLNSMTLYSIICVISISILYCVNKKKKHKRRIEAEESIEDKIGRLILENMPDEPVVPKRRKPRARKPRKESTES